MRPKEAPLAGYLMARTATHQMVDGQDLTNLRAGQASVQKVCDLLPLGRANVIQDIEKAKGTHILERKMATQALTDGLLHELESSGREVTDAVYFRAVAASTLHARTGTCGNFAVINAPVHAASLAAMRDTRAIVSHTEHGTIDHTWTEMMINGRRADGTPILHEKDVIMDGWSKERLAVLREDSEFARLDKNGGADHLQHQDILDHRTGPGALRAVAALKARIDGSPDLQRIFHEEFRTLVAAKIEVPKDCLWNTTSIFHADFREQAGKALHPKASSHGEGSSAQGARHAQKQAKRATLTEIQAVGVARSLGANIRGAIEESPRIIASAKDMFPDPR